MKWLGKGHQVKINLPFEQVTHVISQIDILREIYELREREMEAVISSYLSLIQVHGLCPQMSLVDKHIT